MDTRTGQGGETSEEYRVRYRARVHRCAVEEVCVRRVGDQHTDKKRRTRLPRVGWVGLALCGGAQGKQK
jgi:50S ribosomal subunit-associated GTPase HflX